MAVGQNRHSHRVPTRQGMVVSVYDDMVVFDRREFGEGGALGPEWILPLGWERETGNGERGKHPFSREELKKAIGAPEFPKGAKLAVAKSTGETAVARLTIPLADGNPASRPYAYDVVVVGDDPTARLFKSVYWEGCNLGIGHEPDNGQTVLDIPISELPAGKKLTFAVRPVSSLGTNGKAIAAQRSTGLRPVP